MRTFATITCLILVVAFGPAPIAAAQPSPSPSTPAVASPRASATPQPVANPVCAQAFAVAGASIAASPAPNASPIPVLAIDRLDGAIRACSSLEDWVIGSLMHPEAVQTVDPLALLTERCTDPSTGLDAYATCRSLAVAMATPPPVPTPSPTPEPTPSATPQPKSDTKAQQPSAGKPGSDGLVRLPRKLSVKVPGASKVRYFDIGGQSASTLVKQTLKRARRRCGVHQALACVNLSWQVQTTPSGGSGACTIANVTWTLTSTVQLPRWSKPARVDPALLRWWRKVLKQSASHEAQHIKIQRTELGKLRGRLVGKPCSSFDTVLKRVQKKSNKAQAAFDRRERTRPLPPAP